MDTSGIVGLLVGVMALIGGVVAVRRWATPRWRRFKRDVVATRDSIIGRPAIIDSITGVQLSPPLRGIGERVASLEDAYQILAGSLAQLADSTSRLNSHDERLRRLEDADQDRLLAREESIGLLKTIRSAIRSDPHDPLEDELP